MDTSYNLQNIEKLQKLWNRTNMIYYITSLPSLHLCQSICIPVNQLRFPGFSGWFPAISSSSSPLNRVYLSSARFQFFLNGDLCLDLCSWSFDPQALQSESWSVLIILECSYIAGFGGGVTMLRSSSIRMIVLSASTPVCRAHRGVASLWTLWV